MAEPTTVAAELVEAVRRLGIAHVFCVPGESYLATLQAFGEAPDITLISTRHEEGAGLMAEAYAKASGKPGVCLVTRGPGLTHLSIALHTALQDSTPLLAIVGQVPTTVRYREGFQELDIPAFVAPVSKWAAEITEPDRAGEIASAALYAAEHGRPGPAVLSLPEDIDRADSATRHRPNVVTVAAGLADPDTAQAVALIRAAKRPCIIAGEGITRGRANAEFVAFAELIGAPVFSAWRRFDVMPNSHPLYAGPMPSMPASLYAPLKDADLVIAIGTRLDEFSTLSYTVPSSTQQLLFINEEPASPASFDAADSALVIASAAGPALRALQAALADDSALAEQRELRADSLERIRADYVAATTPPAEPDSRVALDLGYVFSVLGQRLPPEARITSDAGTWGGWLHRYFKWELPGTFFGPTAGGMGYAVPAAIGVKLYDPTVPVVAFAGDGGFAMTMSEIETAVRYGLAGTVFVVFDNAMYGTIAKHQENAGMPGHVGTDLGPVDFAAAAEAMGAVGFTVRRSDEFEHALAAALAADRPAVVHLLMENDTLAPWQDYAPRASKELS